MWDEPALLRNGSNMLLLASLLLVLYGAAHYVLHLPQLLPVHKVSLKRSPVQVDQDEVLQAVREGVQGNFFTVDIERLRSTLERLPWVRGVQIRREFPDRLDVELEEHQAKAYWNEGELVNRQGEVFSADSDAAMPSFVGQPGEAALVMKQFDQFTASLGQVGLHIKQIEESPRHAWRLKLDNGMVVELGSEQMQQRLDRFVAVYPYGLANMQGGVKTVDMRYRNGFAVNGTSRQS